MNYCYVLRCGVATYAGYTVDPDRRLRQHNGEICGGAYSTKRHGGSWSFAFVVESQGFDRHLALSFEWHMKHLSSCHLPHSSSRRNWKGRPERLRGLQRRLACLRHAMGLPKFASCLPTMVVYVAPDLVDEVWASIGDLEGACVLPMDGPAGGGW
jgi:predicted GIY-YIG superfamily endonuclease